MDSYQIKTPEDLKDNLVNKRIQYLEENIASENVRLTAEDLQSIEAIMPAGAVSGTRYPEIFMKHLNR